MPIIVFLSFILCIALYINTPLADPDLWWHVTVGDWIINNQKFPTQDIWTAFGSGKPWLAYSWSNEIVYAFFDRLWGVSGLFHLQIILAFCLVGSVSLALSKISNNYIFGILLATIVSVGCQDYFSLRPQTFIWILFSYLLLYLHLIEKEGVNLKKLTALVLIFCLWANTHISSILGLATAFSLLISFKQKIKSFNTIAAILILFFGATIFTPYFGKEWLTFFSKTSHPFQFSNIQEFSAATILNPSSYILIILYCLCFAFWTNKKDSINLIQLIFCLGMTLVSLIVSKFAPFALISIAAIIARQWHYINSYTDLSSANRPGIVEAIKKLEAGIKWLPASGLAVLLLSAAYFNYNKSKQEMIDLKRTPVAIADFIIDHKLPGPLMNSFGSGGYLTYRLNKGGDANKIKVSIDGRTNLIDSEIWKEYELARSGFWGWQKYIERVAPKLIVWRVDSPLIRLLEAEGKWCSVMRSGISMNAHVLMLKKEEVEELQKQDSAVKCSTPISAQQKSG